MRAETRTQDCADQLAVHTEEVEKSKGLKVQKQESQKVKESKSRRAGESNTGR